MFQKVEESVSVLRKDMKDRFKKKKNPNQTCRDENHNV